MGITSLKPSSKKDKDSSKTNRKFEKKLEFYSKVKDTVSSLSAQKSITKKKKLRSRQKKLKAYDLASLTEFLPEIKKPRQEPTNLKINSKSRQKLLEKESKQLNTVLNHPVFKSDPLAAIYQHLQSTQPPVEEKKEKKSNKSGKKKKGKKSKTSSGPLSMET